MTTTAHGLTMEWSVSRNYAGRVELSGRVNGERRLFCELLERTGSSRETQTRIVEARLLEISRGQL
jgi:hypothetical protein